MIVDASANAQTRRPPSLPENYIYTSCYCEENVYLLAQTFVEQLAARDEDPEWEVYVVFISNDDKTVALWNQRSSKRPDVGNLVVWDYHVILVLRERIHAAATAEPTQDFYPTNNAGDDEEAHHIDNLESGGRENTPGWMPGQGVLDSPVTTEDGEIPVNTQTDTNHDDYYNYSQPQWRTTVQLEGPKPIAWVYDLDGCTEVPCPFEDYMRSTFPYVPILEENAIGRWEVPERLVSLFRVVPAAMYLDNFVSDRSHMLVHPQVIPSVAVDNDSLGALQQNTTDVQLVYSSTPPSYAPLRGRKVPISSEIRTNLMTSFVSMRGIMRRYQLTRREHLDTENTNLTEGSVESCVQVTVDQRGDVEAGILVSSDELLSSASLEEGEQEEYGEVMSLQSFLEWGGLYSDEA